jgi:zinc transport system substrate-binding protein
MGITLLLGALSLAGCRSNLVSPPTPEKLQVVVSIAPQQYFVERIGNGYVKVNVLVPPGSEPHTFEMKPEQLKAIAQAQVYFRIRIDFEKAWLDKIQGANPKMRIVDTTQGIQLLPVETRSPEKSTEHLDPHIWLSPKLVKIQAQTIYGALATLDPKHQAAYQANLKRFLADLDALDAEIRQSLKGVKNAKIVVYHPSWGYFARDYGLQQIPIEVGGQEPSAAELAAIMEEAKQAGVKVIFTEPQFSQQSAQTIAREIGAEVMPVDPLSPDWLNNLRNIVKTFNKTLQQQQALAVH